MCGMLFELVDETVVVDGIPEQKLAVVLPNGDKAYIEPTKNKINAVKELVGVANTLNNLGIKVKSSVDASLSLPLDESELSYRAWDTCDKKMRMVVEKTSDRCILEPIDNSDLVYSVKNDTQIFMEGTSKFDLHDNEIFAGDYIREGRSTYQVLFDSSTKRFLVLNLENGMVTPFKLDSDDVQVIGNIFVKNDK